MSAATFALALVLIDVPLLSGFVSNSRTQVCMPRLLTPPVERCRTKSDNADPTLRQSYLLRLYESKDDRDDDEKNQMKSDDELFRETLKDERMYTKDEINSIANEIFDKEDDDDDEEDTYKVMAASEFVEDEKNRTIIASSLESALAKAQRTLDATPVDWGGALETLSERKRDIKAGITDDPAYAIFRTISMERPNEAIGRFVREANPEIVASMSGAVSSLLGSLSNPAMGIETVVQASSDKLGQLCFQLMMTGYMFRNAEYVVALKNLMNIKADASLQEYKAAFKKLDTDDSGYLEYEEIEAMLNEVYDGKAPAFEVATFMEFFDINEDGKISWDEFEKGFGGLKRDMLSDKDDPDAVWKNVGKALPASKKQEEEHEEEDDEEEISLGEPTVSGKIKVALDDGRVIEVDAQEYIDDLKQQALELKRELAIEMGEEQPPDKNAETNNQLLGSQPNNSAGIARYIASLQGDIQPLTQGISPEVMEAMQMLINWVLEGPAGDKGTVTRDSDAKPVEMELPGSALQQLALWQLVNGYRLRETEAKGDWRKMME